MKLTESGISPATVNSYIRGLNSFLSWLYENEHTPEHLKVKAVKQGQPTLKTFSDDHLKRLLSFRPRTFADYRFYALLCTALDTGARIDELLNLQRDKINTTELLLTLHGKGNKERVVPISLEVRKVLYHFLKRHSFEFVFPTRHGEKLSYRTALDQLKSVASKVGIKGCRVSYHNFRHTFASSYIRDGGNVFYLQRLLGHTDIQTTKVYVNVQTDDLSLMHKKTSLLTRLR
jgi:integrase/recombinase XerD